MKTRIRIIYGVAAALLIAVSVGFLVRVAESQQIVAPDADCFDQLREAALVGDPQVPSTCLGLGPLHYAAMHLDGSFVHALLDAGADIEARTTMGLTALHLAAQHHNLAAITVLLENGANQRVEDARFNRTPLLFAVDRSTGVIVSKFYRYAVPASNEGFDVISALTENGSDVNARDVSGATPLNLAVIHCGTPDLRLLLDAGADPNAQNVAGDTPLYNAIVYENEAARRILLEYGADEDVVDLEGIKVVEKAVAYGPVLRAFFAQTSEINRDQNLSAAQRAERTAEAVRAMKLTLEERHQTLLSSR